jgi:hypothetical protein
MSSSHRRGMARQPHGKLTRHTLRSAKECKPGAGYFALGLSNTTEERQLYSAILGMYDTWISGSDVNTFCRYGLVYLLDSW